MVSYFEIEVHQKCVGKDCCLMHVSITCILEKAQANAQVNLKMHFKLHINKIVLLKIEYSVYSVFKSCDWNTDLAHLYTVQFNTNIIPSD